jgi:hypothetical protein
MCGDRFAVEDDAVDGRPIFAQSLSFLAELARQPLLQAPAPDSASVACVSPDRSSSRDRLRENQLETVVDLQRVGILDVQHAARMVADRLGRGVQDQRAHRHDTAGRNETVDWRQLANEARDLRVGE